MRKKLTILTALLLGLLVLAPCAKAATTVEVTLPVALSAEGTLPKVEETYYVRMSTTDPETPMPDGQVGGTYDLAITGPNSGSFPTISYNRVGVHTYRVELVKGTDEEAWYDTRVYTMVVTVTNGDDGGLELTVALHKTGAKVKQDDVWFHIRYKTVVIPPPPEHPQTGVSDYWMYYLGGSGLLLLGAAVILTKLRRKEQ